MKKLFTILSFVGVSLMPISAAEKPNVVVFLVDDLGYMDIGANNPNCFYETPNIDALAKSGMLFTDGYASCPVCSPSRVSMLTGKYPTRIGTTHLFPGNKKSKGKSGTYNPAPFLAELPLEETTLAEALKSEGYATFFAGKWHLGYGPDFRPQKQGFDVNIGGHDRGGPYTGKKYFAPYNNPEIKEEGPAGEHLPARLGKETSQFIIENKDTPFLAYLSFYSVHTPLMGRKDLIGKYKEKAKTLGIKPSKEDDLAQVMGASGKKSQIRTKQTHFTYAAMVEAMDIAIGSVIDTIKAEGLWDNTIIVFTSDNGGLSTSEGLPTSNKPLNGGKGWMFDGGIREPWIIRYPSVTTAGSVSDVPISGIDLYPTIATAAGYKVEPEVDGVDLKPLLAGGELERDAIYWHYPHYSNQGGIPGGAIRMGDFKLLENYEDGSVALYNLKDDIGELNDLSKLYPEKVAEMRAQLHTWYESMDAKFLESKGGKEAWRPAYFDKK
ncbi:sulfatase [Rubritalea sp.]|uniref:sulfatase n=1 Tax=Rubritalea sp. TaxID=2109375 RepID=UPI003EF729E9